MKLHNAGWLYLLDLIPHNFWFYFWILTCWALQVQLLLQIIINRINLLAESKRKQRLLKYGVAAFITAINISVYVRYLNLTKLANNAGLTSFGSVFGFQLVCRSVSATSTSTRL